LVLSEDIDVYLGRYPGKRFFFVSLKMS